MTKEQQDRTDKIAKQLARWDVAERFASRAAFWVCDASERLGIVDAHGMVDVNGEIARRFKSSYMLAYRAEEKTTIAGVG